MADLPEPSLGEASPATAGYGLLPAVSVGEAAALTQAFGLLPYAVIDGTPGPTIEKDVTPVAYEYTVHAPRVVDPFRPPLLNLEYEFFAPVEARGFYGVPLVQFNHQFHAPSYRWEFSPDVQTNTVYRCVLGTVELKISSFQARLRNGEPTFVGVVVPNAVKNADTVIANAGEQLRVDRGVVFADGSTIWQTIASAPLSSIRYDTGARNSSMTLSGTITQTNTAPKNVPVNPVSESVQATGRRMVRLGQVDFFLRPGDTVEYGNTSWIVGMIAIVVSPFQQSMDVTEAE